MNCELLILSFIQSTLLALGHVVMKMALQHMEPFAWTWCFWRSMLTNWRFALCGAFFTAAGVLWMYIIKHYPLSLAYPLVSLSYVLGMVAAIVFFHETVDWTKWIGVLLIMAGCALIGLKN